MVLVRPAAHRIHRLSSTVMAMSDGRPSSEPLALEESEERASASGLPRSLAAPNVFRVLLHHPPVENRHLAGGSRNGPVSGSGS
jgi:hypothetical protein